jgi:hypothetical protein
MTNTYHSLDAAFVARVRGGGPDANGQVGERTLSDGDGNPCRNCLHDITAGDEMLILTAGPFSGLQPYAETGPIFLCARDCGAWMSPGVPLVLQSAPDYLLKAYSKDERIIYGAGKIVDCGDLDAYAHHLLLRDDVAYVDVRSTRNNCFWQGLQTKYETRF